MVFMLNFITANTFQNIFVAPQDNEMRCQTSGTANAVVSIIVIRKYFVCGLKGGAPELNMSDFARFETDTESCALDTFSLLKYYWV